MSNNDNENDDLFVVNYEEQEDDGEGWLVSYSDLMTLLACFFILMMAFVTFEKRIFAKAASEIAKHFGGVKVEEKKDRIIEAVSKQLVEDSELTKSMTIKTSMDEIELTFKSEYLFESGSADLIDDAKVKVDSVIKTLWDQSKDFNIIVEGHTDNVPISKTGKLKEYYRSNWELSSARAANIARMFNEFGYNGKQIQAIGYADSLPIAPNEDDTGKKLFENMNKNRRVVIKITKPRVAGQRLGLGFIYDKDAPLSSTNK